MGHNLTGLLGRRDLLETIPLPELRLLALPQDLHLAPMPEALLRPMRDSLELTDHEALDALAREASRGGVVGWLESNWFGGVGDTHVGLFRDGVRVPGSQNEMFQALGVVRTRPPDERPWLARVLGAPLPPLQDEWDSLGLAGIRSTGSAWERATPVR